MTKTNKTLLCVLLALVMTFALALTALTVADTQTAKAEGETAVKTLDFANATFSKGVSSYTDTWTATSKSDNDTYTIVNFNNQNSEWKYIKCGRKGNASVARIATAQAIEEEIGSIAITIDSYTSCLNSAKLYISDTSDYTTGTAIDFTSSVKAETVVVEIETAAANKFYTLVFDCKSVSKNGPIQISKVEYFAASNCDHAGTIVSVAATEATCMNVGYQAHYECTNCGKWFSDENGTNVIAASSIEIQKVEHGTENCPHTAQEIIVLKAYELEAGANMGEQTLTGTITEIVKAYNISSGNCQVKIQIGSLSEYPILCYNMENGEGLVEGKIITVTGTIKNYNGTIEFDSGSTYVLASCTHENARFVAEVPATCKTTGFAAHYECDEESCQGKYFVKNGETYEEKTAEDLTIAVDSSKHEYVERIGVNFKVEGEENLYYKSCKHCFAKGTDTFTGFDQKITFEGTSSVSSVKLSDNGTFTVSYKVTANTGINALTFSIVTPEGFKVEKIELAGFLASATATEVKEGVTEYIVTVEDLGADFEYFTSEDAAVLTVTYSLNGATAGAHEFTLQCATASAIDVSTSPATHMDVTMETNTVTVKVLGTETITVADDQSKTYDKTAATIAYSGTERAPTIVWSDDNGVLESAPVNAGVYGFVATFAATDTLEEQVFEGIYTINAREVELTITPNGTIKAYDAVELSYFTAKADVEDEVWELISIRPVYFTQKDEQNVYITAGIKSEFANNYVLKNANEQGQVEYTVVVTVVDGDGNGWINALSTISGTKYYDGKTVQILDKIKASKGTPVVKYKLAGGEAWLDYTDGVILNAGEYTIWAYVVEDAENGIPALNAVEDEATFITYTVKQIKVSDIELDYNTSGEVFFLEVGLVDDDGKTVTVEGATIVYKVNETVVTVDTFYVITATAERGTYTISVEVTGCGEGNVVLCESKTTVAIYEVKFVNGETTVSTSYVFAGQKVAKHADLEEEKMLFAGWFVGENEYKGTEEINADTVVTAKWIALYTVTFKNGETTVYTATDVWEGYTVEYKGEEVTKAKDDYFTYTFSGWVIEGTETPFDLATDTVNGNLVLVATFTSTRHSGDLVLKVIGADNQQRGETKTVIVKIGESISTHLIADENIAWHKLGAWVVEGTTEAASMIMPNQDTPYSITATYVFAIGNGDVDGNGEVGVADITLYRQVIVGGYDITTVENAWETATAEGFAYVQGKFYLAAAADVDEDSKTDIRDVSTIRMALVGGYGYTVDEATNSVVKGTNANSLNSARSAAPKQVLAPMGLFGKKFAL